MAAPVLFWFDFSSPYSYIADAWVDALAARHGRTVERRAILLGATFQAAELKPPVAHPLKRDYVLHDFERSARFEGLPYRAPPVFPVPTQNAARLFWWLRDTRGAQAAAAWATAGLRAMFTQGVPLHEMPALQALAAGQGVDAATVEAVCADPVWKARLKQANDEAIAAGVFGAPFFVVDGEPFWGNDRRAQLERWLAQGDMAPAPRTAQGWVDSAMAEVQTLDVAAARALLGRDDTLFVDIREADELAAHGRVPGALHAPRGLLEFWADPASDWHRAEFAVPGRRLVLLCGAGRRSALAAKALQDLGHRDVAHLGGGFDAWRAAGAPVEP